MKLYDIVRINSLEATKSMHNESLTMIRGIGDVGVVRLISGVQVWLENVIRPYHIDDLEVMVESRTMLFTEIRYRIYSHGIGCCKESFTDVKEALEFLTKKKSNDTTTKWYCIVQYEDIHKPVKAYDDV